MNSNENNNNQYGLSLKDDLAYRPLADRMRPMKLEDVVGQENVTSNGSILNDFIKSKNISSTIFWGPPGSGKTTIARILINNSNYHCEQISAVYSGVKELRKLFDEAKIRKQDSINTVIFVDEIHRFNRSQQDVFLPHIEDGSIILLGATTENPSFELNSALLSRARVIVLNRLDEEALKNLYERAEKHLDESLNLNSEAKAKIIDIADGDGRYLINMIEGLFNYCKHHPEFNDKITSDKMLTIIQERAALYDKSQDGHYNLISALHKSVRASDIDASLYWLNRMLIGGEQPLYIARRMIRMAIEDIGLADPFALNLCISAKSTYEFLGSPEGELVLAQAIIYLAMAPKSNSVYTAYKTSKKDAKTYGSLSPPKHILNAPTGLMSDEGYGEGYIYDHDVEGGYSAQNCFPDKMGRKQYYTPKNVGKEKQIKAIIEERERLYKQIFDKYNDSDKEQNN